MEPSFATAADLFAALAQPDAIARRPVLVWVGQHPAECRALGTDGGRDVVDVLLALPDRTLEYQYWEDVAYALAGFAGDPRVTEFFLDVLARAEASSEAADAVAVLDRVPPGSLGEPLSAIVLAEGPAERIVPAAELLAREPELEERAFVRVATLGDRVEPPPLTPGVADAWADELEGPYAEAARASLERQDGVAAALAERWERLGPASRAWLVDLATATAPELARGLAARALAEDAEVPARAALDAVAALGPDAVPLAALERWAHHPDAALRAAAVSAGARDGDLRELVAGEPAVAEAAIERLAGAEGAAAAAPIAAALASGGPEARAAARDALVGIGSPALPHLRPLVGSERVEVRAAAVRALLDLGDDDWLAATVLDE